MLREPVTKAILGHGALKWEVLEAPASSRAIGDLSVVINDALDEGLMWGGQ